MRDNAQGPLLTEHPQDNAAAPIGGWAPGGLPQGGESVKSGGPLSCTGRSALLPSQQRAKELVLRAAATAAGSTRTLRLCVCGPPSAAADLAVYESVAVLNRTTLGELMGALQGASSNATVSQRSPSAFAGEALGAPAAAAKALKWFVRGSGALTHIYCPAMGALERRSEARQLLHLLIERGANVTSCASNRSKSASGAAAAHRQHQQVSAQSLMGFKGGPQRPPAAHTFLLEEPETFSWGQQRHVTRLMEAAGVGWIAICRAPHRLCPALRDSSCCIRFPRPSSGELGLYLHFCATARAASAAESSSAPPVGYFVALAKAAGCELLAAIQLARRAASSKFPPLRHLYQDAHPQQQSREQTHQREPRAQQQMEGVEENGQQEETKGGRMLATSEDGIFFAGAPAISLVCGPLRKVHRILSRKPANPKTQLTDFPAGGIPAVRASEKLRGLRNAYGYGDACMQLLRGRLCAERPEDADYHAELTHLLAACVSLLASAGISVGAAALPQSVQLREGFLAAGFQPALDLLNNEILRLREKREQDRAQEDTKAVDQLSGGLGKHSPEAVIPEPSLPSREQSEGPSSLSEEEGPSGLPMEAGTEADNSHSFQLFDPDE
ncbi:uncharacterized protein LOC34622040 [Cyclospora cayetanensis]|uniref:Uncharacterized protein LOC34622040 n=1 Tax=Cyclospora cayetanensis TaxID=88456 RepID=A0A6P6RT52_9EIME|nr:uncharacterized protein LOC34622040 [Cyclospora cayetanensis]